MKVQIFGSGCAKCVKLAEHAAEAINRLNLACELEKVTEIDRIVEAGVMITPALAVDGKVVSSGNVLSVEAICELLSPGSGKAAPATVVAAKAGGGKKYLTWLLLFFVLGSATWAIIRDSSGRTPASLPSDAVASGVLAVYYFHGNQRCMTCNRIEELAKAAIEGKFAKEMSEGRVVFRSVNVEEPANEHFIKDFELATRTVVMARDGKYEKFDAVWTLVGEPAKFTAYLQQGADEMINRKD